MDWTNLYVLSGLAGMLFILFGIYRTSIGRWHHSTVWYELDTIVGASLIIVYQLHVKAYVTLPINIFLVFLSFRGLSSYAERHVRRKKRRSKRH